MILSRSLKGFRLIALLAATAARAEDVDLAKTVQSLVDAERAYAKMGFEKDFRAASLAVFADDAVIAAPGITNGRRYWEKETEVPFLIWRPIFASIARSGDLGYTTGPWEYKKAREDEKAQAFGRFVTVWRKNGSGVWKVAVDIGIDHPGATEPVGAVETFVPDFPIVRPESVRDKFAEAEKSFAELLDKDAGASVLAKASDQIRVYRKGAIPAVGRTAAQLMLSSDHGKAKRIRAGGGMSRSNDLAYSYGEYTNENANVIEHGTYFSIWQLDPSGNWRLVLDLQKNAAR